MSKKDKKDKKQKLNQELEELKNKYIRTLAELENSRKRMQKEKTEALSFAVENTISEFLPLIDNFENALNFANNSSEEVKNWATGFQMILSQLKDILHNHGIVAYHSVGNRFDPHLHDAVEIVETNDYEPGSIIEEFAKGYKSALRVIRPARVKVTKKPLEKKEEKQTDEQNSCLKNDVENDQSQTTKNEKDLNEKQTDEQNSCLEKDCDFSKDENIKVNK